MQARCPSWKCRTHGFTCWSFCGRPIQFCEFCVGCVDLQTPMMICHQLGIIFRWKFTHNFSLYYTIEITRHRWHRLVVAAKSKRSCSISIRTVKIGRHAVVSVTSVLVPAVVVPARFQCLIVRTSSSYSIDFNIDRNSLAQHWNWNQTPQNLSTKYR
jgi:hypothetical protein